MGGFPRNFSEITDGLHRDARDYAILKKENLRSAAAHRHSFLELSFVTGGTGRESVNGEEHPLSRGSFTLLLPYHVHEICSSAADPLRLYNIAIGLEWIFRLPDDFGLRDLLLLPGREAPPFFPLSAADTEAAETSMEEMLLEYREGKPWSEVVFRARLAEVLVRFNRSRLAGRAEEPADPQPDLIFWQMIRYVHQHHSEDISLTLLQKRYGIRADRISRMFRIRTGVSFHDFLDEVRIAHACSLLAASDLSVTDIAAEAGFGSYVAFSRTLKKLRGKTALQYRNDSGRLRKNNGL